MLSRLIRDADRAYMIFKKRQRFVLGFFVGLAAVATFFVWALDVLNKIGQIEDDLKENYIFVIYILLFTVLLPLIAGASYFVKTFLMVFRELEPVNVSIEFQATDFARELFYKNRTTCDYPIGDSIGLRTNANILRTTSESGWAPSKVVIKNSTSVRPPAEDDNDEIKYRLIGASDPFSDALLALHLKVDETRNSTVKSFLSEISSQSEVRQKYVNLVPSSDSPPNSLCLHSICEFSDESILILKRSERTIYYPRAYSFSFEEQLSEGDFRDGSPVTVCEAWIRRAICEELFPLLHSYANSPEIAWNKINGYVSHVRIWSLFYEADILNYALMCHIKLSIDPFEFCRIYRILRSYRDRRDLEGTMYIAHKEQIPNMINNSVMKIREIYVDDLDKDVALGPALDVEIEENPQKNPRVPYIHPTALYRLAWLSAAKGWR